MLITVAAILGAGCWIASIAFFGYTFCLPEDEYATAADELDDPKPEGEPMLRKRRTPPHPLEAIVEDRSPPLRDTEWVFPEEHSTDSHRQ